MIVKPKARYEFGAELSQAFDKLLRIGEPDAVAPADPTPIGVRTIPSVPSDGVFIECEAVTPRSAVGRKVTVWIPAELVEHVLLELRDNARERRR